MTACVSLGRGRVDGALRQTAYLRGATEGGRCPIVLDVLLAEPKVSEDDVSL